MKLSFFKKLPNKFTIAFSGGIDSVVLAHVAKKSKRDISLLFIDHLNDYSKVELEFVVKFAAKNNLSLEIESIKELECSKGISMESYWSNERYRIFSKKNTLIATGHHLDDAVEWYLMTCMTGNGRHIGYTRANVFRPMLNLRKSDIINYANYHKLEWIEDPSNKDVDYAKRNKMRYELMPHCLAYQPGLYKTVLKKIVENTRSLDI